MNPDKLITDARNILQAGLNSVDPFNLIMGQIERRNNTLRFSNDLQLDLNAYQRIFVCGAGKGVAPMARAMEALLGNHLFDGQVVVKYGHLDKLQKIHLHEAAHPVPDKNTIIATRSILEALKNLTDTDLVFFLLTGGGSALLEDLPEMISLDDLQLLSKILLECGANIHEINCIRKHISRVKGGQLARHIYPARVVTLALSDVIGDNLSVIASGPTSPDPSSFEEAWAIIKKYEVSDRIPESVRDYLNAGRDGRQPETPKPGDEIFARVSNIVIGSNRLALSTAEKCAQEKGYNTLVLSSMIEGEAKELASFLSAIMHEINQTDRPVAKPACLLVGGEPTVRIIGDGKGGRNQELCLALVLKEMKFPFVFISCGSDGTDGPTDAAGAMVTDKTIKHARELNLDASAYLNNNDSYHFFEALGELIKTGPTGTNVMDLIIALIPVPNSEI